VERGRLLFSACAENLSGLALAYCLGTPFPLALSVRGFQWLEKWIANFPRVGKYIIQVSKHWNRAVSVIAEYLTQAATFPNKM
jgi:hypothetical protein